MMQTISLKATGRSSKKPIVILTGPAIGAQCLTPIGDRFLDALSSAWSRTMRHFTARNIFRAIFCDKVSMAVGAILVAVMLWHNFTIADPIEAGENVATDCLYAMPWALVWAVRATISPEKGGEV